MSRYKVIIKEEAQADLKNQHLPPVMSSVVEMTKKKRKPLTSVSLFSSLGNIHHTQYLSP